MKNADKWTESKYRIKDGMMCATDDRNELGSGSYLIASMIAGLYNGYIPKYAHGRLLDVGCGKVPMYGMYRGYTDDCICIDWENTYHKNEFLDAEVDISGRLPYEDDSFDCIICSDVLEHIFDPISVLDELVRVCKKGGYIMVNTPFTYWIHEAPYDHHRYTPYFYETYAEKNPKVELVELNTLGGWREAVADIVGKVIQGLMPGVSRSIQKRAYKKFCKGNDKNVAPNWPLVVSAVFRPV